MLTRLPTVLYAVIVLCMFLDEKQNRLAHYLFSATVVEPVRAPNILATKWSPTETIEAHNKRTFGVAVRDQWYRHHLHLRLHLHRHHDRHGHRPDVRPHLARQCCQR